MNPLLDDDDDMTRRHDREMTLNIGTILAVFAGLVLLCGGFFGFGYKMGSHKAMQAAIGASADGSDDASANFSDFKPAAGSSDADSAPAPPPITPKMTEAARREERTSGDAQKDAPKTAEPASAARPARDRTEAANPTIAPPTASAPTSAGTGTYFVQVAAVSHEEDAQLLIHALKAKGYPVSARTQPQDKFYHVQVGPFDNRKDADAAKQRLLSDGYQPIIK